MPPHASFVPRTHILSDPLAFRALPVYTPIRPAELELLMHPLQEPERQLLQTPVSLVLSISSRPAMVLLVFLVVLGPPPLGERRHATSMAARSAASSMRRAPIIFLGS